VNAVLLLNIQSYEFIGVALVIFIGNNL